MSVNTGNSEGSLRGSPVGLASRQLGVENLLRVGELAIYGCDVWVVQVGCDLSPRFARDRNARPRDPFR